MPGRELFQLEGQRTRVRMAAVWTAPGIDDPTALADLADPEVVLVVMAPVAAAGVLRSAGFFDRDQCEIEVAIGLTSGANQETRGGAFEPVERDLGRDAGVLRRMMSVLRISSSDAPAVRVCPKLAAAWPP